MKRIIVLALTISALLAFGNTHESSAQRRYVEHSEIDGVIIEYRWANSNWLDSDSPLELRLRIRNRNRHAVSVNYIIDFYMGPKLMESSDLTELCILSRRSKTGRLNGMYYQSSMLSNEEIESEEFSWEIRDLEIEEVDGCN